MKFDSFIEDTWLITYSFFCAVDFILTKYFSSLFLTLLICIPQAREKAESTQKLKQPEDDKERNDEISNKENLSKNDGRWYTDINEG